MPQIAVKASRSHRMVHIGDYIDPAGDEWELYECAEQCGELWKVRPQPWKVVHLEEGAGQLTEADALEITALCKQGPVGQARAKERLAACPGHALVRTPTEDEMREWAKDMGKQLEFEAAVEQSIIEGKPLVRFGMGGATAETWPKGTKRPMGDLQ